MCEIIPLILKLILTISHTGVQTDVVTKEEKVEESATTADAYSQTENVTPTASEVAGQDSILKNRLEESKKESRDVEASVECWLCPMCPKIYKKHSHFKQHLCVSRSDSVCHVQIML